MAAGPGVVVVCVTRLVYRKGVDLLVHVIPGLPAPSPPPCPPSLGGRGGSSGAGFKRERWAGSLVVSRSAASVSLMLSKSHDT